MDPPTVVTDRQQFVRLARSAPDGARIPVEVRLPVQDPFSAYRRARNGPGGVYLATTGGQDGWGYFGVDPVERLTIGSNATTWEPADVDESAGGIAGFSGMETSPTLAALQARLDAETLARGDCSVPYPCGLIGWLSYDIARELESLPGETANDRQLPRAQFGLFDRLAAWREPRASPTTLHITACPQVPADGSPESAYERARKRALALVDRIRSGNPAVNTSPTNTTTARFESECGRAAFADRVAEIKARIRDGETFQTNISQRLRAPAAVHPVAVFDALRTVNPAPYSALLEYPAADLVSASPELLLERVGNTLRTEPIAGTRPRGETAQADAELEADLLEDTKERAEHAMLVDLERNDLSKVSTYGSVSVTEYRRVDRYSEVMHLVSLIEGTLQQEATLADVIAAMFPGGTITGAPKPRTMELIDTVETTRRGPYTGSIGILGFDGRATLNIIIRTLVRASEHYHLRVGAGIVHDSAPHEEYAETLDKARALITAVDTALGDDCTLTIADTATDD